MVTAACLLTTGSGVRVLASEAEVVIKPVGMKEMAMIFEVIDALGISREDVVVPLAPSSDGKVEKLPSGQVQIVIPETMPLEEWLPTLQERLARLTAEGPQGSSPSRKGLTPS